MIKIRFYTSVLQDDSTKWESSRTKIICVFLEDHSNSLAKNAMFTFLLWYMWGSILILLGLTFIVSLLFPLSSQGPHKIYTSLLLEITLRRVFWNSHYLDTYTILHVPLTSMSLYVYTSMRQSWLSVNEIMVKHWAHNLSAERVNDLLMGLLCESVYISACILENRSEEFCYRCFNLGHWN